MTDQLVGLAEQGLGGAKKAGPYPPLSLTNAQFYARCVYYVGPGTMPRVDLGSYPLGSMPPTTALAGLPLAETVSPSEEAHPQQ